MIGADAGPASSVVIRMTVSAADMSAELPSTRINAAIIAS
jgi:hypothetical protein